MTQALQVLDFVASKARAGGSYLLLVLESDGSSPGRAGFCMGVAADGEILGSIGGGAMEHKLVERARKGALDFGLLRQNHVSEGPDRSGMICSGTQLVLSLPVGVKELTAIEAVLASADGSLAFTPTGVAFEEGRGDFVAHQFEYVDETSWQFRWQPGYQPLVHIFGGGHVGLALSQLLNSLGFKLRIYDQRSNLNTQRLNSFGETITLDFDTLSTSFEASPEDLVILTNFSYKEDRLVLRQLAGRKFSYWGMIGSSEKVSKLMAELREELSSEGEDPSFLDAISAPMGLPINSRRPMEIAVSVAAEIIKLRNA